MRANESWEENASVTVRVPSPGIAARDRGTGPAGPVDHESPHTLLALQHAAGNSAVTRMLRGQDPPHPVGGRWVQRAPARADADDWIEMQDMTTGTARPASAGTTAPAVSSPVPPMDLSPEVVSRMLREYEERTDDHQLRELLGELIPQVRGGWTSSAPGRRPHSRAVAGPPPVTARHRAGTPSPSPGPAPGTASPRLVHHVGRVLLLVPPVGPDRYRVLAVRLVVEDMGHLVDECGDLVLPRADGRHPADPAGAGDPLLADPGHRPPELRPGARGHLRLRPRPAHEGLRPGRGRENAISRRAEAAGRDTVDAFRTRSWNVRHVWS